MRWNRITFELTLNGIGKENNINTSREDVFYFWKLRCFDTFIIELIGVYRENETNNRNSVFNWLFNLFFFFSFLTKYLPTMENISQISLLEIGFDGMQTNKTKIGNTDGINCKKLICLCNLNKKYYIALGRGAKNWLYIPRPIEVSKHKPVGNHQSKALLDSLLKMANLRCVLALVVLVGATHING